MMKFGTLIFYKERINGRWRKYNLMLRNREREIYTSGQVGDDHDGDSSQPLTVVLGSTTTLTITSKSS